MKKRFLAFSALLGVIINVIYTIINRRVSIPDGVAYPILAVSVILMLIGCAYMGKCLGKHENPFDFN